MRKYARTLKKVSVTVTTILLGLMLVATSIALENKSVISNYFGSKTFEIITKENGATTDKEYYKSDYKNLAELMEAGKNKVEEVEGEGAVLLKNDKNALPMNTGERRISLFGVTSVDPALGGRGSSTATKSQPAPSVKESMEGAGFTVNQSVWDFYTTNKDKYKRGRNKINDAPWSAVYGATGVTDSLTNTSETVRFGDAGILIVSRVGGEGSDMSVVGSDGVDGSYLDLNANEVSVLKGMKTLKDAKSIKKIIVILNSANQIEAKFINDAQYGIDAVLWVGSTGITGFNAVADILAGNINPSGRLSDMYWNDHADNPVIANFNNKGVAYQYTNLSEFNDIPTTIPYGSQTPVQDKKYTSYMVYQEGLYVGYRYAETRYEDNILQATNRGSFDYNKVVAYPFGYGKSYTNFEYSNYNVKKDQVKNKVIYTATVDVKNTGNVAGKEVVQIYVQKPYNEYDRTNQVEKASVDLVGFAKTDKLEPGKTQTISVEVDERYFTSYDANKAKTYILDAGNYYLATGTNAHDALNNILAAKGFTKAKGMDADGVAGLAKAIKLDFNATKYSKSEATGVKITNLFDEGDINKYSGKGDNSVKYISRNDWAGTVTLRNVEANNYVKLKLTRQMLDEMKAQVDPNSINKDDTPYPTYGAKNGLQLIDLRVDADGKEIPYDSKSWDLLLDQLTWDETALLCSTGLRNTALVESIGKPLTKDHNGPAGLTEVYNKGENGLANKTKDPNGDFSAVYYPCAGIISATFNLPLVEEFGKLLGEDALWAGYAGFYGIAVNTHRNPFEGRSFEYYSEDPILAGLISSYQTIGLQSKGCSAYIKHFALNDQETQRNGSNIWNNEQALREIYFKAFELPTIIGSANNCMASFNRLGTKFHPANKALLTDLLRGEWGMSGFVVTDMYMIGYVNDSMPIFNLAGCDIPDGELDKAKPYDKYKEGYGNMAQSMRESSKRILYTTVHSNAMNGIDANSIIKPIMPDWLIAVTVIDVVLAALFLVSVTFLVLDFVKKDKNKAAK